MIEPPQAPLPLRDHRLILARGPFTIDGETALLRAHGIDHLVTRASGGSATVAKLDAARSLGLPVILIERPAPPSGNTAESVDAALDWLAARLGG
jgi:precorrin-6A/cobalt-precorrin-6A reductase